MLTASFLFSGYSDCFRGYGCADEEGRTEHLLYAYYGSETTLHDIIDQLVEDSWNGYAGETMSEDITQDDVRAALLGILNDRGRADYESGALAECSVNLDFDGECPDCGDDITGSECDNCGHCHNLGESPIFIVVLDCEDDEDGRVVGGGW